MIIDFFFIFFIFFQVFVVYTDSETYIGTYHPKQALDRYRKVMGIEAKLIVVGMCLTEFTLADPNDAGK